MVEQIFLSLQVKRSLIISDKLVYTSYRYGMQLSHIFEIASISNEKPSISIEIPSISIKNLEFRSKYQALRIRNFEIVGFSPLELEILGMYIWNFD